MPFPASWTLITVTATYRTRAGGIPSGYVEFRSPTVVTCDNEIVLPQVIRATLNEDGEISVQLPATDDPQIAPQNFTYQVIERIPGGRSYSISVPYDGGAIDLSEAAEVDEVASFASYQLTIGTVDSGPVAAASITGVSPSQILNLTLPESGVSVGDKGDIIVTNVGLTWTIDNGAVTYAKMQNVSATDRLLGRSTAGAGVVEEIPCTAFARTLLDDADATTARSTLGIVDTQPGGSNTQLQYNNNGTFGGLPLTYTAASGLLRYAPTWDNIATTFTAFEVDATDTNSATASRLLSLKTGGVDRFWLTKRGNARFDFVSGSWSTIDDGLAVGAGNDTDVMVGPVVSGISMRMGQKLQFSSNTSSAYFDRSDLTMERHTGGSVLIAKDSAATNTVTTVQTLRVTSSGTPAANIGVQQNFEVETSAGNVEIGATVQVFATTITPGSELFEWRVTTMGGGTLTNQSFLSLTNGGGHSANLRLAAPAGGGPTFYIGGADANGGIIVGTTVTGTTGAIVIGESNGFWMGSSKTIGWASSSTGLNFNSSASIDTGFKRVSAAVVGVTNGSTGWGSLHVADGTVSLPAYSFGNDPNTGMFRVGADNLGLTVGGFKAFDLSMAALTIGVLVDTQGSSVIGDRNQVTAYTSDQTINNTSHVGRSFTNKGAAGEVVLTLPTAVTGLNFRFSVEEAQFLRAKAAGTDTIRYGSTVSAAAGYIRSNDLGVVFRLECMQDGQWKVTSCVGTPTIDS